MKFGLRARVALAFAVLSFVVAGVVAGATYAFANWYLVEQRENAALTRALLDARAVDAAISSGASPAGALDQVPSVGTSQPMVRASGTWYTASISVPPDQLPSDLLEAAARTGARQRVAIAGDPYTVVAVPVTSGLYVEVFPMRDLDRTLTLGGWGLVVLTLVAAAAGGVLGATTAGRVLGPVRRLGAGARQLAGGDLGTRISLTGDADLDPIAESFNEMAEAVQQRIARERRFAANVSHELRSPMTSILGTTELLEGHADRLPERDAGLVTVLSSQVRRLSQMLLDLLAISRIDADDAPQWEQGDVAALCREVAAERGIDPGVITGDEPIMRTDARRFERILGNILDNAERHGGGVSRVHIQRDPQQVRIVVDDRGPGIAPEERERLFEPFARGTRSSSTEGAGLGLAIVRDQAQILGATITIDDAPRGGARITITLPIHGEES